MPCRFGWADVGSWLSVGEDAVAGVSGNTPQPPTDVKVDGRENVTIHCEALFDNAAGNIVRLSSGRQAMISGLDGFVIAEEGGVLMICPKGDDAAMRRLHTLSNLDKIEV